MGYYTRFTGEIKITPPIPWMSIKDGPFLPRTQQDYDVKFRLDEEVVDTLEGQMLKRSAVAVVPSYEDAFKGYDIVEHLQTLVNAFPAYEFSGRIDCEGEESGDLWRLQVRDRRAVRVEPRIVWPED